MHRMTTNKWETTRRASFLSASSIARLPKWQRDQVVLHMRTPFLRQAENQKYNWYREGAREPQKPPPGDWRAWLLLAGRGFGKTRAGAEFVRANVMAGRAHHIALVAPTALDARSVMVGRKRPAEYRTT